MEYSPLVKTNNLELRAEILEYALIVEDGVNQIIMLSLGLFVNKEATKSFAYKASLSFKNKIDLLVDLGTFSKEDCLSFELLITIRNKFLHDIHCNSFEILYDGFDSSLKKRFDSFIDPEFTLRNEEVYRITCLEIFGFCSKAIGTVVSNLKQVREDQANFYNLSMEIIESLWSHQAKTIGGIQEILELTKNSYDFVELRNMVFSFHFHQAKLLDENEELNSKLEIIKGLVGDEKSMFKIFGIHKLDL